MDNLTREARTVQRILPDRTRDAIRSGLTAHKGVRWSGADDDRKQDHVKRIIYLQLTHLFRRPATRAETAEAIASATGAISIGYEGRRSDGGIEAVDTYLDALADNQETVSPTPERPISPGKPMILPTVFSYWADLRPIPLMNNKI